MKFQIIVSANAASVVPNLGEGRHCNLALTMAAGEYLSQMGHAFVLTQNLANYPPKMDTVQEKALRTDIFQQNQLLFCGYTAINGYIKKQIITSVEEVFLSPIKN